MKLFEIFNSVDKERALADFEQEKEFYTKAADRATDAGDMIITQYEIGELSYEQALRKLTDKGYGHYEYELAAAKDTREYRLKKNH